MTLGEIIKKYRKDNGLSMDAFSEKSGISKAYISLLEKNQHPKTGNPITPSIQCIKQAADAMHIDFNILFSKIDSDVTLNAAKENKPKIKGVSIPVLGYIRAGIPIDVVEETLGDEEIHPDMAASGNHFALRIKGDSMEPKFSDGDIVIVREQSDVDSGDIAIVLVNGDEGTVKKLMKYENGSIALVASNPAYQPIVFTPEEIESLPVLVIGKVVELRAKF